MPYYPLYYIQTNLPKKSLISPPALAFIYIYIPSLYFLKCDEKFFYGSSLAVLGQVRPWWIMHWIKVELPSSRGHNTVCSRSLSTWLSASAATGWLPSKDVTAETVPCKTKPSRSGFYLVLSNDKSLPHSTASAAGTCWRPSVKGIVYVVGDPELITIPPSPIHYCSSC